MATGLLDHICQDVADKAPGAKAGLAEFFAARVLRKHWDAEDYQAVVDADPADLVHYVYDVCSLEGEALATAQAAVGKLTPPARNLPAGAASTMAHRHWTLIKELGQNRAVANRLVALDWKAGATKVAQDNGIALRSTSAAAASKGGTAETAVMAQLAAATAAAVGASGGSSTMVTAAEKAKMRQGKIIDHRLIQAIERGGSYEGQRELEMYANEWIDETEGMSDTELRAFLYDVYRAEVKKGFRTRFQEASQALWQLSVMQVQTFSSRQNCKEVEFLRQMSETHTRLMTADVDRLRMRGDGQKVYEEHIQGTHVDPIEWGETNQPSKAETRAETTLVEADPNQPFSSQYPLLCIDTSLLTSSVGLFVTAGVTPSVTQYVRNVVELLNREDGSVYGLAAGKELVDMYQTTMTAHVGQEEACAAASVRLLTDHFPSTIRALFMATTAARLQKNQAVAANKNKLTLDQLLESGDATLKASSQPLHIKQLAARLRRVELTLASGEPDIRQEGWGDYPLCPTNIRPPPTAQGLIANGPGVFPSKEKGLALQPWLAAMEADEDGGGAIVDDPGYGATTRGTSRRNKRRRKKQKGAGPSGTTAGAGTEGAVDTGATGQPPAASPRAAVTVPGRAQTPAQASIDLTQSESTEETQGHSRTGKSPFSRPSKTVPAGRSERDYCAVDLTKRPVEVRLSRDVIWAINDAARDHSPQMRDALHHKVYKPEGLRLCDADSILSNHYVRDACEAARVPASELRCARGAHCRFAHRCEDTAGAKKYQALLPEEWDKIQWNAMDAVRECKELPFGENRGKF